MNRGVIVLREADGPERLPVMVSGAGRSGTTAIARIMGAVLRHYWPGDSPNAEDEMTPPWRPPTDLAGAVALRQRREADGAGAWVAKVPDAIRLAGWDANWTAEAERYAWLVAIRDPVAMAVAIAAAARIPQPMADNLRHRLNQDRGIIEAAIRLASRGVPVALVSYEKVLSAAACVIEDVWAWAGVGWTPADRDRAVGEIRANDDPRYYEQ